MKARNRAIAVAAYGAALAIRWSQFMIISFAIRFSYLENAVSQLATKESKKPMQHEKKYMIWIYKT